MRISASNAAQNAAVDNAASLLDVLRKTWKAEAKGKANVVLQSIAVVDSKIFRFIFIM